MTSQLALLLGYSALMIAVGAFIGRRVQSTDGFFVASRGLGPGLLFATLLAANVGAGSTVGAASLGYDNGVSAWWWVGAAAIGSLVQAFWVGPWMRREASARGLKTVGDYLEQRYSTSVRVIVATLLWFGTLAILAGQLIAMSTMRSIIEQLGTEKYPRLRLGVGRPPGIKAAAGYVLKDFRGEDLEIITLTLDRAAEAAECFLREGLTTAMNRFNGAAEAP